MPPFRRLLGSGSFRLALVQTLLFAVTFLTVGAAALVGLRQAEHRAAHAELEEFEDDVSDRVIHLGAEGLAARYRTHRHERLRDFRLEDAQGRPLVGDLIPPPGLRPATSKFWSSYRVGGSPAHPGGDVLAFTHPEPDGLRLIVGEYLGDRERHDDLIVFSLMGLAAAMAVLGVVMGARVSRGVLRRVDGMVKSIDRYASGDRAARVGQGGPSAPELDDLAGALNRMMDRENRLVEGLRQVSSAIAHDLRRPLSHHNQKIREALATARTPQAYRQALTEASARVDEALETFQALLHIAELEAGAPGLALVPVDLDAVAARVVEAYAARAEAEGRPLTLNPSGAAASVRAEPRILGQVIANLIENALTHTPDGTRVEVRVEAQEGAPRIVVTDDGPGVPAAIRGKIFERFFRQDASRSTPGSGLGLALAAAAVRAFGGRLWAEDAAPGLRVVAEFAGGAKA